MFVTLLHIIALLAAIVGVVFVDRWLRQQR